jgi:hypothetical protein
MAGALAVTGGITGVTGLNGGQLAGNRNIIINGDFTNWQRGTSQSALSNAGVYLADRWTHQQYQNGLHTRQAFSASGTHPGNSQYVLRASGDSTTATTRVVTTQGVESINCIPLRGKTITMSLYLRCAAATMPTSSLSNLSILLGSTAATADGAIASTDYLVAGNTTTSIAQGSLPTTWTKITNTYTVPTDTNNIAVYVGFAENVDAGTGDWYEISQVQVEIGSTATPFEQRLFGTELALCQRYYEILSLGLSGSMGSATVAAVFGKWAVSKRADPTITYGSTANTWYIEGVDASASGTLSTTQVSTTNMKQILTSLPSSTTGDPVNHNGTVIATAEL